MFRVLFFISTLAFATSAIAAATTMKMNFKDMDVTTIIEEYSKNSGQKFIIDPGVRGKISIFIQEPVTTEEAFNHLSTALAINGFAISPRGDTMVVRSARNTQRDLIEVGTQLPAIKPEKMYTWVISLKNISADKINRDLRILQSKDGEMSPYPATNQLVITDWTPNLNRISEILKELDKPVDAKTAKFIAQQMKDNAAFREKNPTSTMVPPMSGPSPTKEK